MKIRTNVQLGKDAVNLRHRAYVNLSDRSIHRLKIRNVAFEIFVYGLARLGRS